MLGNQTNQVHDQPLWTNTITKADFMASFLIVFGLNSWSPKPYSYSWVVMFIWILFYCSNLIYFDNLKKERMNERKNYMREEENI